MNWLLKNIILLISGIAVTGFTYIYIIRYHELLLSFLKRKCPALIKKYLSKRIVRKIEAQLVDVVDMLANALKAGLSLQQAFQMISYDAPSPIKNEFTFIINQIRIGKSFDDSLVAFKERAPLDDVHLFVESILILRQTGGNLVETFSCMAETIRERQKVNGKIKILTAQGVAQAVVILVMPFVLGIGLYFVAGWYIKPLLTTSMGWILVIIMLCLQTVGALWLRKIITIKV